MKSKRILSILPTVFGVAAITFSLAVRAQAQTETILLSFNGTKGKAPYPAMIFDSAGNLYGTTKNGGNNLGACAGAGETTCGIVFELSRDHTGAWKETVIHSFTGGRTGYYPYGAVVQDAAGNLYGTTAYGGLANGCGGPGCGVVYRLSRNSPAETGLRPCCTPSPAVQTEVHPRVA